MDDRSRHYMFGSRFGDFSDRNDIDTYSSASDTDSDSDWDRDPAPKITFITPVYVTHYPALSAERFIGFPHIVLTGNPPRQPVLGKNEKVNLEHADDIYTYLYHYHPDALKAFLDMNNDFFVFRTEAKKNEHDTDIILIREENKITGSPPFTFQPVPDTNNSQLGCLGHRSVSPLHHPSPTNPFCNRNLISRSTTIPAPTRPTHKNGAPTSPSQSPHPANGSSTPSSLIPTRPT